MEAKIDKLQTQVYLLTIAQAILITSMLIEALL
jgi:hypothetical protein